jgi:hypothetical protein
VHILLDRDADRLEDLAPGRFVTVHRLTSAPGCGVTVVRPDSYIGFRSRTVEADQLAAWLALVNAADRRGARSPLVLAQVAADEEAAACRRRRSGPRGECRILAVAVLAVLVLNAAAGWWQADPLAALIIVVYALREAREIFQGGQ